MRNLFSDFFEAIRFTCEAQGVVTMRLSHFAAGGAQAEFEATEMVTEKIMAVVEAQIAAVKALEQGCSLFDAAERAYAPFRQRVHANSERLMQLAH